LVENSTVCRRQPVSQTLNPIQQLGRLGQSVWYDNIRRGLIESGELQRLIDLGVTGLTSNPTIFQKAIAESSDYDEALEALAASGSSVDQIYEALTVDDIRAAADLLRSAYDDSAAADGYASLEVSPHLANDTNATIDEARRLFQLLDRPNVMVKVPATPAGIPAVHKLIGEGINVNVTLTFSLKAYRDVRGAYIAGLEDLRWAGGDLSRVASVASFFISRVDTAVDSQLGDDHDDLKGDAAIANAKLAYRDFKEDFGGDRFAGLAADGARVQRPLWASTSTKNPEYNDVMYPEALIGPDTVDTMPEATLLAFMEHGAVAETLEQDVEEAERLIERLGEAGVDMDEVTAGLLSDGLGLFADSYDDLLADIAAKKDRLMDAESA
jgi:transaldolase